MGGVISAGSKIIQVQFTKPQTQMKTQNKRGNINKDNDGFNQKQNTLSNHKKAQEQRWHHISSDNIERMIEEASRKDTKESIDLFNSIKKIILNSGENNFICMERLAFVCTILADLYSQANYLNHQQVKANQVVASGIYKRFQTNLYEQFILFLNNSALREEKNKRFDKAIKKYHQIVEIQKKYYSINDERVLICQNNLACAYCEINEKQNGFKIFQALKKKIESTQIDKQIVSLVQDNYQYYQNRRK